MQYKNVVVLMFAVLTATSAGIFARVGAAALRTLENDGKELAILDPREEGSYGLGHLSHAVNIPLSKLELNVDVLVPRRSTRIVLTDGGEGTAERAAVRLKELGYTNLAGILLIQRQLPTELSVRLIQHRRDLQLFRPSNVGPRVVDQNETCGRSWRAAPREPIKQHGHHE
jgi:rhodanese-related sulfurtransferase